MTPSFPAATLCRPELILATLAQILAPRENPAEADLWDFLARENELFNGLKNLPAAGPVPGVRLLPPQSHPEVFAGQGQELPQPIPEGQVELLLVDQTFGTEELAGYSSYIWKVEKEPVLMLSEQIAQDWGLTPGEPVTVHLPGGEVTVILQTAAHMSPAVAVLPRHHRLDWQKLDRQPLWLGQDNFKKAKP